MIAAHRPHPANEVYVTGTFDDWGKTEKLEKVGDAFEKEVTLKDANTKILYKFVVDGQWINDHEGPQEDDGSNNVNNVLHPEHIKKAPVALSSAAPESTTAALAGAVPVSSSPPGAFPETPAVESEQTFGVAPIPSSSGMGNPSEGATASTIDSSATTSKEAYDNAGEASVFPGEKKESEQTFGVAPIPSSSGMGNEGATAATIDSSATTSKEAYDNAGEGTVLPGEKEKESTFGVAPIPASSGIGNPISTKPGEVVPEQTTSHTVDSTATTSKEDYEKAGSYSFPAAGAGLAGALAAGAAAIGFGTKHENEKKLIPESSLPMGANSTEDAGPHIQSAGPQSTTAALAANVPLESEKAHVQSAGPQSTTTALAAGVPLESEKVAAGVPEQVKESLDESHQSAEAAASSEAVKHKEALEQELLTKTSTVEATGESAKEAIAAQTSYHGLATTVPKTVEESMAKADAPAEAAADPSVVAEKSALERELEAKVPKTDETGEPAPVVSAETSAVAPAATAAAATGVAAGAAASALPDRTSAGVTPGASRSAAAAISDGADDGEDLKASEHTPIVSGDKTEGDATEYAPVPTSGGAPGVSDGAAAAVCDGADIADEPAVKMMNQNETGGLTGSTDGAKDETPVTKTTETATPATAATTTTTPAKEETKAAGVPPITSTSSTTTPASATSTPTKKPAATPTTTPDATKDKKKKHRISSFFKKILN